MDNELLSSLPHSHSGSDTETYLAHPHDRRQVWVRIKHVRKDSISPPSDSSDMTDRYSEVIIPETSLCK